MIRGRTMICAESVLREADTNNYSLIRVFVELMSPRFPIVIPRIGVLAVLERDPSDPPQAEGRVTIDVTGARVHDGKMPIEFQDKLRSFVQLNVNGLQVTSPGTILFQVLLSDRVLASCEVQIRAGSPTIETSTVTSP